MTNILIGGDVCPIGRNRQLFQLGQADAILNNLLIEFEEADYSVVNLECPLIERKSPIEKDGRTLGEPVECVNGLKAAGIDAVNLANNHILDHGETGLRSTLAACANAGIKCFGAGANRSKASRILFCDINGRRIGFLGIAEHEFSIAGEYSWGANPLDIIETVRLLKRTKNEHDFLVTLVHGGREHYPYPSPRLQQVCRFLVEEGAGAVICQHSHCAGCYEYYQKAPIVYGQGNFIFDPLHIRKTTWNEGFLVQLILNDSNECHAEWIPFAQSLDRPGVRRMPPKETQAFVAGLEARSREISVDGAVQRKWLEYCRREKYAYASRIRGHNRLLRVINRKLHFSDWLYSKTTKLMQRNVVECEIHREALETLWHDMETDF